MDKNWKVKNEGLKKIEEIIVKANNRIESHGLHDMMGGLKQCILDKNKNVLKTALILTAKLASAMGPGAKAYNKLIMVPVLENLSDKQSLVKRATVDCIDAWAEHVGPEHILNICGKVLKPDNPDVRTELLKFIQNHPDGLPKSEAQTLVKPLIACLQDKNPKIRAQCEDVVCVVMKYVKYNQWVDSI